MLRQIAGLLNFSQYQDPIQARTALNISIVAIIGIGVGVVMGINNALSPSSVLPTNALIVAIVALEIAALGALWLVRIGYLQYASPPLIGAVLFPTALVLLELDEGVVTHEAGYLWVAVILAVVIANRNVVALTGVATAFVHFLTLIGLRGDVNNTVVEAFIELTVVTMFLTILGILISNDLHTITEKAVAQSELRRLQLIETSNAVSARIFSRLEQEALLRDAVEIIRERFDQIYHAQVFLLDTQTGNAVLRASTGEVGKQLIARQHQLPVGSQSVIGRVTASGEHVLASNTNVDSRHKRNELLPDTRTELALPLRVEEGIIGVLDLQSRIPNVFNQEDVDILQTLADQIAIAIDNAQLLAAVQTSAEENLRLLQQEQQNRHEIERLNRELVGKAWEDYVHITVEHPHQAVDMATGHVMVGDIVPSPVAKQAMQTGQLVVETTDDGQKIAIPIIIQGATVATIDFDVPPDKPVTDNTRTALRTIGERVGLIAENARLFEAAQEVATSREQLNRISSRLQGLSDIETLLSIAVSELGHTLGAQQGHIQLQATQQRSIDDEWVEVVTND